MINPTESLAFSMQANPGVYAVLVGSGVSRAAKIPTGWEITLDLVRKLAALRKENCDPDPERWYLNTFNKEANYLDLLDALCGTPAERQQLLRDYFEPSADDRDEQRAVSCLGSTRSGAGYTTWVGLGRYPGSLLLYALGIGAMEAGRLEFLGRLLEAPIREEHHEDKVTAATGFHPLRPSGPTC